jgi:hypothetical protein
MRFRWSAYPLIAAVMVLSSVQVLSAADRAVTTLDITVVATGLTTNMPSQFTFSGEYQIFNTTGAKPLPDGAIAVDRSLVEFQVLATTASVWNLALPLAEAETGHFVIPFDRRLAAVHGQGRWAAAMLKIEFNQTIQGSAGWKQIPRVMELPIQIPDSEPTTLRRCLAITGQLDGGLHVGIVDCPDSAPR